MSKGDKKKIIKGLWYFVAISSVITLYSILGKGRESLGDDIYRYTDYVFTPVDWNIMIVAGILVFVSIEKTMD